MKPYPILFIFLLTGIAFPVGAQKDTLSGKTPCTLPDAGFLRSCLTDTRDILVSPARWNQKEWIVFTGAIGGTVLCFTVDSRIREAVQRNNRPFLQDVARYGLEPWGSGLYTLPALGILYGAGALTGDSKAKYTALKGTEAFLFGAVAAQVLNQLTHRHHPSQDNPPDAGRWGGPFQKTLDSSFPSGHATMVFAVAAVVATSYKNTVWVPVACYSLAGLTAISRVYQDRHWLSDVFAGSILGFAIGKTLINNQIKRLEILPVSHTGSGIMLVYRIG